MTLLGQVPNYSNCNPNQVGAVITFSAGLTENQVRKFLTECNKSLEGDESKFSFETIQTGLFDAAIGRPVFYVP